MHLSTADGHSSDPMIETEQNNLYVVWHDTAPGNADVFLAKSTDNGTSFGNITNISNNRGNSLNPQIIKFEDKIYAVWKDFRLGDGDIYFTRHM